jgi:hypothetical protein
MLVGDRLLGVMAVGRNGVRAIAGALRGVADGDEEPPFQPSDEGVESRPIPESWVEQGTHGPVQNEMGESRYYAVRVAFSDDHDQLLVQYHDPIHESSFVALMAAFRSEDDDLFPLAAMPDTDAEFLVARGFYGSHAGDATEKDSAINRNIIEDRYGADALY